MERKEQEALLRKKLERFAAAWESGTADALDELMVPAPSVRFGIWDCIYSRQVLKERLKARGTGERYDNFAVTGCLSRIDGARAQQAAALTGRVQDGEKEPYRFCGLLTAGWTLWEGDWKIAEMSLDLRDDNRMQSAIGQDGRLSRMAGSRKGMPSGWKPLCEELAVFDGCALPTVCGELQSGLLALPDNGEEAAGAVKELFSRYAFAFDNGCFGLLAGLLAPGCQLTLFGGTFREQAALEALKAFKNVMGARGMHMVKEQRVTVEADTAHSLIMLQAQGSIQGRYQMEAVRADGGWLICSLAFIPEYQE